MVGQGSLRAARHSAQVSAIGPDVSNFSLSDHHLFDLGIDFFFGLLELSEPTVDICFGAAAVTFAEMEKDNVGTRFLLGVGHSELGLAHGRGNFNPFPIAGPSEAKFADLEG